MLEEKVAAAEMASLSAFPGSSVSADVTIVEVTMVPVPVGPAGIVASATKPDSPAVGDDAEIVDSGAAEILGDTVLLNLPGVCAWDGEVFLLVSLICSCDIREAGVTATTLWRALSRVSKDRDEVSCSCGAKWEY